MFLIVNKQYSPYIRCKHVPFFIKGNFFSSANDISRNVKQNQIIFCIQPWILEFSRPVGFGEDQLWERGSLPATFYVLTMVIFSMTNGNCRTFKQNQRLICIRLSIVKDWRLVDWDVYKRQVQRLNSCFRLYSTYIEFHFILQSCTEFKLYFVFTLFNYVTIMYCSFL